MGFQSALKITTYHCYSFILKKLIENKSLGKFSFSYYGSYRTVKPHYPAFINKFNFNASFQYPRTVSYMPNLKHNHILQVNGKNRITLGGVHSLKRIDSRSLCTNMTTNEKSEPEHDLNSDYGASAAFSIVSYQNNKLKSQTGDITNGHSNAFSEVVSRSASCLHSGGVIAVPTDTIYGIACLSQNTEAVNRIYEIKNRNFQNPVAISVGHIDDIYKWGKVVVSREVLTDLLPGPVTVVFERTPDLNPALNPHTHLVGIRIPDHTFIQSLARHCDSPIALTSANVSGATSCLTVKEFENLWSKLDFVVNGGKLSDTEESRRGSTVVDLSMPGAFRIIRPGSAYESTVTCLQDKHKLQDVSSLGETR